MKKLRYIGVPILVLAAAMMLASCATIDLVRVHDALGVAGTKDISAVPESTDANVIVGTLAGEGKAGLRNGLGVAARFRYPVGMTVDPFGNVFVADFFNQSIRQIEPNGEVSIPVKSFSMAGSYYGPSGFTKSGPSGFVRISSAGGTYMFVNPIDVAVGADGNLYVVAYDSNIIWKVVPGEKVVLDLRLKKAITGGKISILTGKDLAGDKDGSLDEAQFKYPRGIAADIAGNIYVADTENHRIRKITVGGKVLTLAGDTRGFKDGAGAEAQFDKPVSLAVDLEGNVFVADTGNHSVRKITTEGIVSTLAGNGERGFMDASGTEAQFNRPTGVAVDSGGNVYVADQKNNLIRKITPEGIVSTLAGSGLAGFSDGNGVTARFKNPYDVAVDLDGNVYVSDTSNQRVRMIEETSRPSRNVAHANDTQRARM